MKILKGIRSLYRSTIHRFNCRLLHFQSCHRDQRPQFLETLARCHETLARYESPDKNIGVLMRWGYTENVLENLRPLAERTQGDDELLLNGLYGLAANLNMVDLPMSLQRPLSEEDRERNAYIEEWNRNSLINRIRNQEQLLIGDSPEVNANRNYYGLDRLAVRKDLDGLCDEDQGEISRILHHVSTSTEPKLSRDLLPWIAKYAPENYSKFACDFKIDALNPEYPAYVLGQIQELVFEQIDCERITEAILETKEGLVQEDDSSRQRARLIIEILLFSASGDKLIDWFKFLASHESLRKSIFTETLQVLLNKLLPEPVVKFVQQKLKISQSSSFDNQFPSNIESEKITEEDFWWWIYLCICDNDENVGTWALENLKRRKSNVHSITFHSLCKATRDSNRFLSEVFTDENVRKHLFLKKGRFFTTPIYEGENSYSYEDLVSVLPQEIVGSYLCSPQRRADLSQWGKELMERLCSILQGPRVDFDYDREMRFRVNPKVLQTWAEQHTEEFSQLANKYFIKLSESPWYRQELRNFTNAIFCLLLRFQPDKARQYYYQWNMENSTTQYKATNFLHQLWQVKQCNSLKHHQFRRELLEACLNDEEIMFMSVIALAWGGKEELWNLVTQEYLESDYAKERNLGVSILPWLGTYDAVKELERLISNDQSKWVREHATWRMKLHNRNEVAEKSTEKPYKLVNGFRSPPFLSKLSPLYHLLPGGGIVKLKRKRTLRKYKIAIQNYLLFFIDFGLDGKIPHRQEVMLKFAKENFVSIAEVRNF